MVSLFKESLTNSCLFIQKNIVVYKINILETEIGLQVTFSHETTVILDVLLCSHYLYVTSNTNDAYVKIYKM